MSQCVRTWWSHCMCVCVCEALARNGPSADGDRIGNSETVWSTTCALRRQWCEVLTRTKSTCNLQTLNEMGCCCCCCCFCTSSQMRGAFVLFYAIPQQQRTGKHQQVPKLLPTQLAWSRSTCDAQGQSANLHIIILWSVSNRLFAECV